jgi:hypothetical protein
VLFDGTCYMKDAADAITKYPREGRATCKPKKLPPMPCVFEVGYDWHPETELTSNPAADQATCCDMCGAQPGCVVAVLDEGTCYLKGKSDAVSKYVHDGRVSCQLKKNASRISRTETLPDGDGIDGTPSTEWHPHSSNTRSSSSSSSEVSGVVEHSVGDVASSAAATAFWAGSLVAPLRTRHANVAVAGMNEAKAKAAHVCGARFGVGF